MGRCVPMAAGSSGALSPRTEESCVERLAFDLTSPRGRRLFGMSFLPRRKLPDHSPGEALM